MQEFKKRRSRNEEILRLSVRTLGAVLLLVVTVFAVRAAWGMYGKFIQARNAKLATDIQLSDMQGQYEQVGASVEALSSSRGVEAQIRQRYGVVKPGEGEIRIVLNAASTSDESIRPPSNIVMRIWNTIFPW